MIYRGVWPVTDLIVFWLQVYCCMEKKKKISHICYSYVKLFITRFFFNWNTIKSWFKRYEDLIRYRHCKKRILFLKSVFCWCVYNVRLLSIMIRLLVLYKLKCFCCQTNFMSIFWMEYKRVYFSLKLWWLFSLTFQEATF